MSSYTYPRATPTRIIDADTLELTIDLGFYTHKPEQTIRLLDVNAHETWFVEHDSEEYRRGMEEKQFVSDWIEIAEQMWTGEWPLIVHTEKDERGKYGRYLGYIERKFDGEELTERLLEEFDGIEYDS